MQRPFHLVQGRARLGLRAQRRVPWPLLDARRRRLLQGTSTLGAARAEGQSQGDTVLSERSCALLGASPGTRAPAGLGRGGVVWQEPLEAAAGDLALRAKAQQAASHAEDARNGRKHEGAACGMSLLLVWFLLLLRARKLLAGGGGGGGRQLLLAALCET